jgi:Leucine-rich repeat (LRR) protein
MFICILLCVLVDAKGIRPFSSGHLNQSCVSHSPSSPSAPHTTTTPLPHPRNRLLENLLLHGNEVTSISADLQQLRSLKILRLDHNRLTKVENIDRLGNLTYLDLSHNRITDARVRASARRFAVGQGGAADEGTGPCPRPCTYPAGSLLS